MGINPIYVCHSVSSTSILYNSINDNNTTAEPQTKIQENRSLSHRGSLNAESGLS